MTEQTIGKPTITFGSRRNTFEWDSLDLKVVADRITDDGVAELYFYHRNGSGDTLLHLGRANLLSPTMPREFIKVLSSRRESLDWQTVLTHVTCSTMDNLRRGEDVIMLTEEYGKERPEYVLPPLFVKDAPNIVYADRSSAKSLFAVTVAIALTLPWHDNNIGLNVGMYPHKILYLDWEASDKILGWTKECLRRGLPDAHWCDFAYLHCAGPISDSVHHIQHKIEQTEADIIIIDSLGMAVGDDLNLTKPAFAFFGALRLLPVTPIILAHTAKSQENRRRTVYGNAYYENEARSIWEVVKEQQPGQPELNISLFQRKSPPFAGYSEPLAWRYSFEGDIIYIETSSPISDKRDESTPPSETDIALEILYAADGAKLSAAEILARSKGQIKATNIYTVMARIIKKPEFSVQKDLEGRYYYVI